MSDIDVKKKVVIPKIFIWVIVYLIGIVIAYFVATIQKEKDLTAFKNKIDEYYAGHNSIYDYVLYGDEGELLDAYISDYKIFDLPTDNKELRTKRFTIAIKPNETTTSSNEYWLSTLKDQKEKWNRLKDIKQYFESENFSGFHLVILKKDDAYYTLENYWSGDMAYLVPDKEYYEGYNSPYFSSPGYYLPKYRPSINKCYEGAAEFLAKESKSQKIDGASSKYYSLPGLKSKFYHLEQNYPRTIQVFDSIFMQFEKEGKFNPVLTQDAITKRTSANDAVIYDSYSKVWYKSLTNTYRLEETKNQLLYSVLINSAVVIFLITCIRFYLYYHKRVVFK